MNSLAQLKQWLNKDHKWERFTQNGKTHSWSGYIAYWMEIPKTPDDESEWMLA